MIFEATERIQQMERCFDALQAAADTDPASIWEDASLKEQYRMLTRYYESGSWLRDYELDEQGLLPPYLKRGVLSQDAVYDLLERIDQFRQNREESTMQVTIDALEAYLYEQYDGCATEQGLFMKLVEEIGEVAEVLNKRSGRKAADSSDLRQELGIELADMLHYVVAIAAINNLNLNDIILSKDKKAAVKYHHDFNLETFLSERYHKE